MGARDKLMEAADREGADEHAHQSALFAWASGCEVKEELKWFHAVPNGGDRDRRTAGQMAAEGVESGVWDTFLPVPGGAYDALYLEMKRPGRETEPHRGLPRRHPTRGATELTPVYACKVYHPQR